MCFGTHFLILFAVRSFYCCISSDLSQKIGEWTVYSHNMRLEYSFSFPTTALPSSGWQHLHGPIQQSREGNPGTRGWPGGCVFSWRSVFSVDGVSVCSFSYTQQAKTIRWSCPGDCTLWIDLHPPGQALCIAGWWMSTKNGGSPLILQPLPLSMSGTKTTGNMLLGSGFAIRAMSRVHPTQCCII